MKNTWVFGYGSLIWRPGFNYIEKRIARLPGWRRVFWQGSHDHRGTPEKPGRVVTLVPQAEAECVGTLYLIDADVVAATFENLDHREKNGYDRIESSFNLDDGTHVEGICYIASIGNEAYLGEASLESIARQIIESHGPSGANLDYLLQLADALRAINADDDHVFALESSVKALLGQQSPSLRE